MSPSLPGKSHCSRPESKTSRLSLGDQENSLISGSPKRLRLALAGVLESAGSIQRDTLGGPHSGSSSSESGALSSSKNAIWESSGEYETLSIKVLEEKRVSVLPLSTSVFSSAPRPPAALAWRMKFPSFEKLMPP